MSDPLQWWPGKYAECKRIAQLVDEFLPAGEVLECGGLGVFADLLPGHRVTTARVANGIDLCHLPWEDGRFDVGVSARVIEILPPGLRRDYLLELVRVSRYRAYVALQLQPELEAIDKIKNTYIWDSPRIWSHRGLPPQELDAVFEGREVCVSYHVDPFSSRDLAEIGRPRELLESLLAASAVSERDFAPAFSTPAFVIAEIVKTDVAPLELTPFSQAAH